VDASIISLIARRLEIAREIGLTKLKAGIEIRDTSREDAVVREANERADAMGLRDGLVAAIVKMLIDEAVQVQLESEDTYLRGRRALVIGSGRMGAWTARFLSNRGARVSIYDPRGELEGYENVPSVDRSARDADIIVVAGPLGTADQDLRELLEAKPSGVVFDLCSVKAHIRGTLLDGVSKGFKITSVHPMFGPGSITPKGQNVIICSCGSAEADTVARELFESSGAAVAEVPLDDHDRLIAQVLGAPHLCALLFGRAISSSAASPQELDSVQGPSFSTLGRLTGGISKESRRVYHDIQRLNPHTAEMIRAVEEALQELKAAALCDDPAGWAKVMDDDRRFFGGWS
jgi:chorismate mutase / prephenate dehydrogenase